MTLRWFIVAQSPRAYIYYHILLPEAIHQLPERIYYPAICKDSFLEQDNEMCLLGCCSVRVYLINLFHKIFYDRTSSNTS